MFPNFMPHSLIHAAFGGGTNRLMQKIRKRIFHTY